MSSSFATEFDILKASHKFLREGQDAVSEPHNRNGSWNDQVAQKYYDTLFREFAVCDLKHYKSGNVAIHLSLPSSLIYPYPSLPFVGGQRMKYSLARVKIPVATRAASITTTTTKTKMCECV